MRRHVTSNRSPAMTLENMRSIGVCAIEATCECGNKAIVDVSALSGAIEVPETAQMLGMRLAAQGRPT